MTDKTDEALLAILKRNARESVSSIARSLGLSRSTVQDRLARLEERGPIAGYTVVLDEDQLRNTLRAFATVMVEPQKTAIIVKELGSMDPVDAVYTVSGKFDLLVEISAANTAHMDRLIDRISEIPGVTRTETSIVLSTKIKR